MSKVPAYHTITPEDDQRNVYHDYDNCPQGSRIKPENRRPGENGRSRCDECKQLD